MKAIDLFAGLGGFTLGATRAGVDVVWAANHWQEAVKFHAANHPGTQHACQDLHQADWSQVPRHDILCASPACQGHTHARGVDKPRHDVARTTAWAVVSCAEHHRPACAIVENVPGFQDWVLFPVWLEAFKRLGYQATRLVVDAADFGVPQNRERLFIIFTRSEAPLDLRLTQRERVPALRILEPIPATTPVRRLCANTRRRWRAGCADHGERFLLPYYSSARTGRSLSRPLGTVTTKARFALAEGNRTRMLTVTEYRRAMDFPDDYLLPEQAALAIHLLGNAVPPAMACGVIQAVKERL